MQDSFKSLPSHVDSPVRPSSRGNLTLLTVTAAGLCVLIGVLAIPRGAEMPAPQSALAVVATQQPAMPSNPEPAIAQTTAVTPSRADPTQSPHSAQVAAAPRPEPMEEQVVSRSVVLPMSKTGHGEIVLKRDTDGIPTDLSSINANAVISPQFASFSDVFTPLDGVTSARIKDHLRTPMRLLQSNAGKPTISSLTDHSMTLLCPFGSKADPKLKSLIEDAVFQRQSNDYIATLVNTTATRDKLRVPASLRTTRGDWDTGVLLQGMAQIAGGSIDAISTPSQVVSRHVIQEGDSLAGISTLIFGHPFQYKAILEANPHINKMKPNLVPGEELVIQAQ